MPRLRRSTHRLSHHHLTTCDMGQLVPIGCVEVLMGDTFFHRTSLLLRAATLVAPVMHPVDVRVHHWYVPNRIIWDKWDEFITGQEELTVPTIFYEEGVSPYDLLDHLGVPKGADQTLNALPIRAYNLIWNEFYRDQDIQEKVDLDDLNLKRVAWQKDYFTSCRPTPQKGEAISIPLSLGTGMAPLKTAAGHEVVAGFTEGQTKDSLISRADDVELGFHTPLGIHKEDIADGSQIDINEFRLAMAMQRHLEARNRFGSRIQDFLAYHGIRPRDGRLDLPEYVGGGRQVISFSEVLATAEGANTTVGDMAGHGIAALRTRRYGRFFPESGWLLSLVSVRPRTMYANQLHRSWLRSTKHDFWQKEYEMLGPQAVLVKEVYGQHPNNTDIFGYNGRHDDYRRHPSYVSGRFRDATDNYWHMARILSSAPTLNESFIECVPTDRIYADTSEPELRLMVSHDIRAKRLVSKRPRY